jgi:two-component system, NarL family, response regulator LiaR
MTHVPIRLAIVDDYEVVVRGLAQILSAPPGEFDVVELDLRTDVAQHVDLALYDTFAQTQGGGPDVARLVDNPRVDKVVIYSWNVQDRIVQAALDQGVAGYLSKELAADELVEALRRIHAGEVVAPTTRGDEVMVGGGDWPGREQGLTPREAEVVALITQGHSNHDIAEMTCLSINSVKSYIRSSYRKMGVTSRTNAVLWGLEHGFAPDRFRLPQPT